MGEYICNSRTKKGKYLEYIQNFKSIKKKKDDWMEKLKRLQGVFHRKKERKKEMLT